MCGRKQGVWIFAILMFCYAFIHQGLGMNQNSRLALLRAVFLLKTMNIDAEHSNTSDKSIHEGHYYSDKAPGIALLGVPAFVVSLLCCDLLDFHPSSYRGWMLNSWITTVGSVGLITALGGVALFFFLTRLVGPATAFITTFAVFLGAAPFPYATMFFSHGAVLGMISIALWAAADASFWLRLFPRGPTSGTVAGHELVSAPPSVRRSILAGVCCGLSIASEYTAAPAAGGVLALSLMANWRRGLILALAAVPPLLLIPLYNWACFGGPFSFGYHHLALTEFQTMNQGLFGVTWPPKASAAYLILASPRRGLFFWTPFFFLIFCGVKAMLKVSPKLFWVSATVIVLQVVFISGYFMPDGGGALGPRHLAPVIPFLAVLAAFGAQAYMRLGLVLGCLSIVLTGVGTAADAMPSSKMMNPLINYYWPLILEGRLRPTWFSFWRGGAWAGCLLPFLTAGFLVWYFVKARRDAASASSHRR